MKGGIPPPRTRAGSRCQRGGGIAGGPVFRKGAICRRGKSLRTVVYGGLCSLSRKFGIRELLATPDEGTGEAWKETYVCDMHGEKKDRQDHLGRSLWENHSLSRLWRKKVVSRKRQRRASIATSLKEEISEKSWRVVPKPQRTLWVSVCVKRKKTLVSRPVTEVNRFQDRIRNLFVMTTEEAFCSNTGPLEGGRTREKGRGMTVEVA